MKEKIVFLCLFFYLFSPSSHSQTTSNPFCVNGNNFQLYTNLGFGSFRFHVNWFLYDNAGTYDFSNSDLAADFYALTGIEPVIVFKCDPGVPDTSATADTTGWSFCEKEQWVKLHNPDAASPETSRYPSDSVAWKNFLEAFVERYDGDGVNDYPGLVYPFKVYQLEVEIPRVWCTNPPDTFANSFVNYANYSYSIIKNTDAGALVKIGGWDSGPANMHLFYLGYINTGSFPVSETVFVTRNMLDTSAVYQAELLDFLYVFSNASYDILDIHCYGNAEYFPSRAAGMRALFDTLATKPLWALEGGGPFLARAEIFNPLNDNGYISPELAKENAAYVVRYYTGGLGSGFTRLAWHIPPEYEAWGQYFGDLNLLSIDYKKKPSYWTYAGLASLIAGYITVDPIPDGVYWQDANIVGYEVVVPGKKLVIAWNLAYSADITLTNVSKQYLYPVAMGDSLWDTLYYNVNNTYSFNISRVPVILEGDSITLSVEAEVNPDNPELLVYPNPFSNSARIVFNNNKNRKCRLILYNATGQVVRVLDNLTTSQIIIERKKLNNGLYFFQLITETERIGTGKFIIE
ncbi:MAG: T9SS type A sorting domain-containing protein [Chlorobi bacterium]|nr:T9SS type A sorting domain-containing protein [Chlorobiota bacterium]